MNKNVNKSKKSSFRTILMQIGSLNVLKIYLSYFLRSFIFKTKNNRHYESCAVEFGEGICPWYTHVKQLYS